MNKTEIAKLLTYCAAMDNRKVTPDAVEAWHATIGDLPFGDAMEAARLHYRESFDYLDAAAIFRGVRRVRRSRLDGWIPPTPLADPSDVSAYLAELRASVQAKADGQDIPGEQITEGIHPRMLEIIEGDSK